MRAMQHNSRTNSKGRVHGQKHNDRNFDVTKANNIVLERIDQDIFWNWTENPKVTFEEAEKMYYEQTFSQQLKKTNDNYIKNRHPENCKTMDEFMRIRKYCPEETTVQIGKMEHHVDQDTFEDCFFEYLEYMNEWNKNNGYPFQILNFAVHADEEVPHAQIRRVWKYEDENGVIRVGQEKALTAAGVNLPKPDEKEGKRNHRKMVFDAMMREKWLDICEAHGIDIEREPVPDAKHNRDKEDMIRDKNEALIEENNRLQREQQQLKEENERLKKDHDAAVKRLDELYEANKREVEFLTEKWDEKGKLTREIFQNNKILNQQREEISRIEEKILTEKENLQLLQSNYESKEQYVSDANLLGRLLGRLSAAIDAFVEDPEKEASSLTILLVVMKEAMDNILRRIRAYEFEKEMPKEERLSEPILKDLNQIIKGIDERREAGEFRKNLDEQNKHENDLYLK